MGYLQQVQDWLLGRETEHEGGEGPAAPGDQDLRGNQAILADIQALMSEAEFEAPHLDVDFDRGVHVDAGMGAMSLGDTRIAGPASTGHLGAWDDEHGLQTGVAVDGHLASISSGDLEGEAAAVSGNLGAWEDDDGPHAGVRVDAALGRGAEGEDEVAWGTGHGEAGVFETETAGTSVGYRSDLALLHTEHQGVSANAGHANLASYVGEDGAEVSGNANAIDGETHDPRAMTSEADTRVGVGLSEGVGGGVRARWGGDHDGDGDGRAEYGVGVDYAFAGADMVTEGPDDAPEPVKDAPRSASGGQEASPARPAGPADMVAPTPTPGLEAASVEHDEDRVNLLAFHTHTPLSAMYSMDRAGDRQRNDAAIESALRTFQADRGLPVTGEFDAATTAALGS